MAEKQTAKRNRREEILQSLALMLESSDGSQRITTAKLAASVGVSEAALYRHFPSKTRMFDSLIGLPLPEAGRAVLSWNMEEASEALAAVNAWYNAPDCPYTDPESRTLDGIDTRGRTVGMIGMMIGHSNMTEESFADAKRLYIMDREEKPGAMPDSAAEFYLPLCDLVIITGSAAINKSLPRLLELSRNAQVILAGPSVSCCPALLQLGIDRLHGRIITQPEAVLKAIVGRRTSVNSYSVSFLLENKVKN